jgi:hypothetical protein
LREPITPLFISGRAAIVLSTFGQIAGIGWLSAGDYLLTHQIVITVGAMAL